jgi:hypothetical protein
MISDTMTTNLKNWVDVYRVFKESCSEVPDILINENFQKIENIKGLKTNLYDHQKPIIKAMYDLENNRDFNVEKADDGMIYKIKTNAGVLSEPVGSGKTIDILGLILLNKIPRVLSDISELNVLSSDKIWNGSYTGIIRKQFSKILVPTIIFVGVSVINQWVNAIKTFTNLKYFPVYDVRDLQQLINKIVDRSINRYDIVIVKNGKITRPIILPDDIIIEEKNTNRSILYIYNIITNLRNYCWARVVIDDFDTIKLPHNAGTLNGLFTWYISSTKKHMNNKSICNKQFTTTDELLMYSNYNCGNIMNNAILFNILNIRSDPEFVKKSNMISSPIFYAYIFKNINNQYMSYLGLMNDDEASEIMEMLNGDALETAAERIGIKTDSVADIFQIILGKQFEKYKKAVSVLDYINKLEPDQGNRIPMSQNNDSNDTYKKSDLFLKREVLYNYPNLKHLIETTKEEYTQIRKDSSVTIERVKNNIKEGDCPICLSDLDDEDEDIIIVKCCGVVICGTCCFGTVFPKNSQHGQCSNCRTPLNLKSLIYLNSNIDLNKIIEEDIEPEKKPEDISNTADEPDDTPVDKFSAILNIINGKNTPNRTLVDVTINNLMKGNNPTSIAVHRKVLIFANYEETLCKINKILDDNDIKYWKLHGLHGTINKTVEEFTKYEGKCALIINSVKHCAGLNLQACTDLIFAHKILDNNIETQVVGRGQRLGRTNTMQVHFMFYENEYEYMINNNTIREI